MAASTMILHSQQGACVGLWRHGTGEVAAAGPQVRLLQGYEFCEAERVWMDAHGVPLDECESASGFVSLSKARSRLQYHQCIGAFDAAGSLLGFVCGIKWGIVGYIGPMAVDPRHEKREIAQDLLRSILNYFTTPNAHGAACGIIAIQTNTQTLTPLHAHIFSNLNFQTISSVAIMTKPLAPEEHPHPEEYTHTKPLSPCTVASFPYNDDGLSIPYLKLDHTHTYLAELITNLISSLQTRIPGCDVSREMDAVLDQRLGAVLYFVEEHKNMNPIAFAILHHGPDTEAREGHVNVKFLFAENARAFDTSLKGIQLYALDQSLHGVDVSCLTSNTRACRAMLDFGFEVTNTRSCMVRHHHERLRSLKLGSFAGDNVFMCADFS